MPDIDPLPAPSEREWVFLAMFKCARCGTDVTVRHYAGDPVEGRMYRHLRVCPDGCREPHPA